MKPKEVQVDLAQLETNKIMKEIIVVKGTSGAGKSSRVFVFLKFLRDHLKLENEIIEISNKEGKMKPIGFHFPELNNLLILGKMFKSGDIERFQGYDNITSTFGSSAGFSKWLRLNKDKYSVLVEGAGVTRTNRLRPLFLYNEVGFKKIFMQYYNFTQEQKPEYMKRIVGRSGKEPGEQMWSKNIEFVREINHCFNEKFELKEQGKEVNQITILDNPYNIEIDDLGLKLMLLFYPELDAEAFILFCLKENYISKNKFENFQ